MRPGEGSDQEGSDPRAATHGGTRARTVPHHAPPPPAPPTHTPVRGASQDLAERIAAMLKRFQAVGAAMILLAFASQAPWVAALLHFKDGLARSLG